MRDKESIFRAVDDACSLSNFSHLKERSSEAAVVATLMALVEVLIDIRDIIKGDNNDKEGE